MSGVSGAGAPLVPVFVFGQTDAYGWMKLGPPAVPQELAERLARAIGFLPLFMYGVWGTPLPRKVPPTLIHLVIGLLPHSVRVSPLVRQGSPAL